VDTLVVRRSKGKLILLMVGAIALVPLGALYALGVFGDVDPPARLLGWLAVVLAPFGVARIAWMLRQTAPVMEIGPAGFHDRRLSAVPIPWQRIDGITVEEKPHPHLQVAVSQATAQEYVRSGVDSALNRGLRALNGGAVSVNVVGLDHSLQDVLAAIQRWHAPRR
jgi:hypothetical protein